MSAHDAHYGGDLVDGARMLALFGDVATELLIRLDGDEGRITRVGNTSRAMEFEARKVIVARTDISDSAADFLAGPIVVCRASGTCVTPKEKKRR